MVTKENTTLLEDITKWYKDIKNDDMTKLLGASKFIFGIGIFMGFMYLFSYTTNQNIPFPLSISQLIPAFLVILFVATLVIVVLLGLLFIPVIARSNMFSGVYVKYFENEGKGFISNFLSYLCSIGLLLVAVIMLFFLDVLSEHPMSIGLLTLASIIGVTSIGLYIWKFRKQDKLPFFYSTGTILFVSILWFVILIRFTANFLEDEWFEGMGVFLVVFSYIIATLVINYIMVGPVFTTKTVKSEYFVGLVLMLAVISPFHFGISSYIAGASLSVLGLGGGKKVVYYIDDKHKESISKYLIEKNNRTKELFLILDLGDRVYVRLNNNKNEKSYSIKRNIILNTYYSPKQ